MQTYIQTCIQTGPTATLADGGQVILGVAAVLLYSPRRFISSGERFRRGVLWLPNFVDLFTLLTAMRPELCTGCFSLKTDQIIYPESDLLPDLLCTV